MSSRTRRLIIALLSILLLIALPWAAHAEEPRFPLTKIALPPTQRVVIAGALLSAAAAAVGLHYARNSDRRQRWSAAMGAALAMGVVMGLVASWIDAQHRRSETGEPGVSAPANDSQK